MQRPRGDTEEELNMFEYYGSKGSTTFIDLSSGRQIGLSSCARRALRSDDRTHISSCRTPITPATYRCTIKITNGCSGCVEVCNKGFIKQQQEPEMRTKFKNPAVSPPGAAPGNTPSLSDERRPGGRTLTSTARAACSPLLYSKPTH